MLLDSRAKRSLLRVLRRQACYDHERVGTAASSDTGAKSCLDRTAG
jgi:hypothetical protein